MQQDMVKCTNCGNEFSANTNFCPHCGVAYIQPITGSQNQAGGAVRCSNCGSEVPSGGKFCPKCGSDIGTNGLNMAQQNQNLNGQQQINPNMNMPQQNPNVAYQQQNMMRCPGCGNIVTVGIKKCPYCGLQLKEDSHTLAIVAGYIFACLGGLLGLFIGIYLVRCKEEKVHIHGYIQIAIVVIWIIIFFISMA